MDRGGLVGSDGPTHHGVFDLSYLATVPNVTVAAPKDGNELRAMLHHTIDHDLPGVIGIRYPREIVPMPMRSEIDSIDWGTWEYLTEPDRETVVLAVGTMVHEMNLAMRALEQHGIHLTLVNARFVKPFDTAILKHVRDTARTVITVEENSLRGGFGEAIARYLLDNGYQGTFKSLGIPDRFITHGSRSELLRELDLDAEGLAKTVRALIEHHEKHEGGLLHKLGLRKNGNSRKKDSADIAARH
jgi:1-deoxy-D-xylulose-5-phosphate synthase